MPSLRLDTEQRFSCAGCARCCTRPWEIVVTPAETATYRARHASRWFRDLAAGGEGTDRDPFEPIAGTHGFHRIRKRSDGACGFLSLANRCRLHEELGARAKPLTCRMFPFAFHPVGDVDVATASFACPTVVANAGASTSEPAALDELKSIRTEWFRTYPRASVELLLVPGRRIAADSLKTLRASLAQMLSRHDPDGRIDLRSNVTRMANMLDDLSRPAVLRLEDEAFDEYVALTTPFAAKAGKPPVRRRPSWLGRLMQRGFLFVTAATQFQIEHKSESRMTLGLRLKLFTLLAHFHGLAPGVGKFDLRLGRGVVVDVNGPELQPIVQNYLRSNIETLGTGVRPVIDELGVAVSALNAACRLAAMKAARTSQPVDAALFSEALVEAVDVTHADYGLIARVLSRFSAGTESLYLFGS